MSKYMETDRAHLFAEAKMSFESIFNGTCFFLRKILGLAGKSLPSGKWNAGFMREKICFMRKFAK